MRAAKQKRITIVQLGENKGTDDDFGCFNSQVLADRADASGFHVNRTAETLL